MDLDIYETENSIYVVDLTLKRYMRMPSAEKPRTQSEIHMIILSDHMNDNEWHDLEDMEDPVTLVDDGPRKILNIRYKGSRYGLLTTSVLRKNDVCISSI